jgi:hypothetical protein
MWAHGTDEETEAQPGERARRKEVPVPAKASSPVAVSLAR